MLRLFDPFPALPDLDRATERAFENLTRNPLPMDAVRRDNEVVVWFDMPGFAAGDIDLTVEKNVLTLTAERHLDLEEGDKVIARERTGGSVRRQIVLGDSLDTASVSADYDSGVLTVRIQIAEQSMPQKVSIGGGSKAHQAIETTASEN